MLKLKWIVGILASVSMIAVVLISSVEAVVYFNPGYFQQEYTKYNVADAIQVDMDTLLAVTEDLMAYLKGQREHLDMEAVVNGAPREFFSEREKLHLADVRILFMKAVQIRRIGYIIGILSVGILMFLKKGSLQILSRAFQWVSALFLLGTGSLAVIGALNFTKAFTVFHELFFSNDLWILDPSVDLLINMVPEPFFIDTAVRIAVVFTASMAVLLCVSLWIVRKAKAKNSNVQVTR